MNVSGIGQMRRQSLKDFAQEQKKKKDKTDIHFDLVMEEEISKLKGGDSIECSKK